MFLIMAVFTLYIKQNNLKALTGHVWLVYAGKIVRKTIALFLEFGGVHTTGKTSFSASVVI